MKSCYINTDVEISAPKQISALKEFFASRVFVLWDEKKEDGNWHIWIEANESGDSSRQDHHPVRDIKDMLVVLTQAKERFPEDFECFLHFDFNIGIEAPTDRPEAQYTLPKDILKSIIDIGATVTITVYPFEE